MLASCSKRSFKINVTSAQAAVYAPGTKAVAASYLNTDNMFGCYALTPRPAGGIAITTDDFATKASVFVEEHPLTGELGAYVGVNVLSRFDRENLAAVGRPFLNAVIALDISGSMASRFSEDDAASKLAGAKQCLLALMDQLEPEDTLGIVLFNTTVHRLQEQQPWGRIDQPALKKAINALAPGGGTNLALALEAATNMLAGAPEGDGDSGRGRTSRTLFMTDLQSSSNSYVDEQRVMEIVEQNSAGARYTTVVGIGIDLNQQLVRRISSVCGCRYMSASRTGELASLMSTDFAFDVTIIARDVQVSFEFPGAIGAVKGYGSTEVSELTSNSPILISSEFPASSYKGGMYVFKLDARVFSQMTGSGSSSGVDGRLVVRHSDANGITHTTGTPLHIPMQPQCSLPELRKAVALIHYVEVHNDFLESVSDRAAEAPAVDAAKVSVNRLLAFRRHFMEELVATGDYTLASVNQGDLQLLDKMIEVEALDAGLPVPVLLPALAEGGQGAAMAQVKQEAAATSTAGHERKMAAQQKHLAQAARQLAPRPGTVVKQERRRSPRRLRH